jgi:Spy/CpxP family protein refolding chaperone
MTTKTSSPKRSRRFWLGAVALGLVGTLVVASSGRATHGWRGHGSHHGHGLGETTPEEARDHAQAAVLKLLQEVDATQEQQQRIDAIIDESVTRLYPLIERHQQHHLEFIEALSQPVIDRGEVERLRKAEMEIADEASDGFAEAALDAFEVLTPKQRSEVVDHVRERHM